LFRAIGKTRRLVQGACFIAFLALFLYVCWPYDVRHHAEARAAREIIEAEAFLALDPLVSVSTALAARAWVWSIAWAGVLLAVCLVVPRGFCAYVCPLGTLLDLFDWAVGRRVKRQHVKRRGWWVHLRYYVLAGVLAAAACGVLLTGFVAAIPVFTRGMMYLVAPVQLGLVKGWYLIPPMHAGHYLSIALFVATLGLGLLATRFWCRYLCPSGAIFSVASLLRLTERKVTAACIGCGKCVRACPFDAIEADYSTRVLDCTFCQTCGGVCPVNAIEFGWRSVTRHASRVSDGPVSRRGFAIGLGSGLAVAVGVRQLRGAPADHPPLRPPGSVTERQFLQMCVRCGECLKACPYNALQPMGFEGGLEALWTPHLVPDWVGCEPKCNNCGQVCPTGAIRALPLEEKRAARVGLAVVNPATCLPLARRGSCVIEGTNPPVLFCQNECTKAGYNAISILSIPAEMEDGRPVGDEKFMTPDVDPEKLEKCNGCGLCQTRCYHVNVKQRRLLQESAIVVVAGADREDRLTHGSYIALREETFLKREQQRKKLQPKGAGDSYVPPSLR